MKNFIEQLKDSKLKGRGGGGFETWIKWDLVKKTDGQKYIICNGAEGELNSSKDEYILKNYPSEIISGIVIGLDEIKAEKAYLYLKKDYYQKYKDILMPLIGSKPIIIFEKPELGYIAGEETVICEIIEGKEAKPRLKPPYLSEKGLFGCPTLINNLETFFWISKIAKNEYQNTRFFDISGDIKNPGIFELDENITIKNALKETNNYPDLDFFIQAGGGASGEILLPSELDKSISKLGSIIVFNQNTTDLYSLMEKWALFFYHGNCDKCLPCREGTEIIYKMVKNRNIDYNKLNEVFSNLKKSSFCALGKNIPVPFETLYQKVINPKIQNSINIYQ